ncbi:DUF262 domain-containing protein [Vibrio tubiashii]|uniref:DUF262 domain-containing protein n=1 Tax=Vibrio tubiashii TaxID=29498 RepID=UPI00234FA2F7|nr:DUF262 domain-containing protein [Vibrio tubiashii]WCP65883.1 DUF262 domain-containing protein [Vibrio tubiashii]
MSFSYNAEPKVVFLTQALKELQDGVLRIPRFQRELVWTWSQKHDLLCSVLEGLPIGAMLVWQTRQSDIKSHDKIGPFSINNQGNSVYNSYLMDGLQRLSTLFGTLLYKSDDIATNEELEEFNVYCDLNARDNDSVFILYRDLVKIGANLNSGQYMPLSCILESTRSLLKFQRSIPFENEEWIDRSDTIASAFKNYKIPIVPLEADDQAVVTKSFERINSRGTPMSEIHMLNALSYKSDFDLIALTEEYTERYLSRMPGWKNIDNSILLSVIKLNLGLDLFFKNTDKLASLLNQEVIERAYIGILKLAEFSEKQLGITSPGQFPYKAQTVGLAFAFSRDTSIPFDELQAWYYLTSYTGAFGNTAQNVSNTIKDLANFLDTGSYNWSLNIKPAVSIWSKNTQFKTARVKVWASALCQKRYEENVSVREKVLKDLMSNKKSLLKQPDDFHYQGLEKSLKARAGFYFISESLAPDIPQLHLFDKRDKEQHFLNDELIELWNARDFEGFASKRELLIYKWEVENIVKPSARILKFDDVKYEKVS